ncbi:MAG: hypothetical protein C5B43_03230, partial [Verrucomicrobia bacterium]
YSYVYRKKRNAESFFVNKNAESFQKFHIDNSLAILGSQSTSMPVSIYNSNYIHSVFYSMLKVESKYKHIPKFKSLSINIPF